MKSTQTTSPLGEVPYELSTVATLGGLGWDSPPDLLVGRAKEVLTAAGVSNEHWTSMSAPRKEGSTVELLFLDPCWLSAARMRVKALQKTFH